MDILYSEILRESEGESNLKTKRVDVICTSERYTQSIANGEGQRHTRNE